MMKTANYALFFFSAGTQIFICRAQREGELMQLWFLLRRLTWQNTFDIFEIFCLSKDNYLSGFSRFLNKKDYIIYHVSVFRNGIGKKKKCNLHGGNIFTVNIVPMPKIWNYFSHSNAFLDEIIRGNIIYSSFHQLVINMGNICLKYLPQKGKIRENSSCLKALVILVDLSPFSTNISPY